MNPLTKLWKSKHGKTIVAVTIGAGAGAWYLLKSGGNTPPAPADPNAAADAAVGVPGYTAPFDLSGAGYDSGGGGGGSAPPTVDVHLVVDPVIPTTGTSSTQVTHRVGPAGYYRSGGFGGAVYYRNSQGNTSKVATPAVVKSTEKLVKKTKKAQAFNLKGHRYKMTTGGSFSRADLQR